MTDQCLTNRRHFLKASLSLSGGLALALHVPSAMTATSSDDVYPIHSLIEIDKNGAISIGLVKHEMGQGVDTSLPRIIADEMDANWDDVTVFNLDYDDKSRALNLGEFAFSTGGSGSIQINWKPYRTMGAAVRELFCKAAAQKWQISQDKCITRESAVYQKGTDLKLTYAELVKIAAQVEVPPTPTLKNKSEFTLIGKACGRVSARAQVTGQYNYSIDEKILGMVYASLERSPVKGGKIKSYNKADVINLPGVIDVITLDESSSYDMWMTGAKNSVAVIAKSNWAAIQGRKALQVVWDQGSNASRNSDDIYTELLDLNNVNTRVRKKTDTFDTYLKDADHIFRAEYRSPYLDHALMEPLHAIARINGDGSAEVWAGTQDHEYAANHIARELNIDKSQVTVHAKPSGGGFGRRYMFDYVIETVLLAKKTGQTISLLWTREDEIQHGRYHPQRLDRYEIGITETGEISAFGFDGYTTHPWGANTIVPRRAQSHKVNSHVLKDLLVNYGSWRSVGQHLHHFSAECVIDELAHHLGKDPLEYRLHLMGFTKEFLLSREQDNSDSINVLYGKTILAAATMAGWGRDLKPGVGLGIGAVKYKKTPCVQIAEVEVNNESISIKKIFCAIDCGLAVNPNHVKAQVEGSIIWALSPLLHGGVDVINGQVVQSNFDTLEKIRIDEVPEIEIQIINSDRAPCGVGEPAVPPLAPAVYNAYFAATGKRLRSIPLLIQSNG